MLPAMVFVASFTACIKPVVSCSTVARLETTDCRLIMESSEPLPTEALPNPEERPNTDMPPTTALSSLSESTDVWLFIVPHRVVALCAVDLER